jgi:hypothetical protein
MAAADTFIDSDDRDALAANRAGLLSRAQARRLRRGRRGQRVVSFVFGVMFLSFGLFGLGALLSGNQQLEWEDGLIGGGFCVLLGTAVLASTFGWGGLDRDLREARVAAVEGPPALEFRSEADSRGYWSWEIGGRTLSVGEGLYAWMTRGPRCDRFRVYYLPRSEAIVNVERL